MDTRAKADHRRVVLLVFDPPSSGPEVDWPSLPLGLDSLARRGGWARVRVSTGSAWPSFAYGASDEAREAKAADEPFWQLLEEAGRRVVVLNVPPTSPSSEELRRLVTEEDWHFLMIRRPCPPWDDVIESLDGAADSQTAVMVLGLPPEGGEGLLVVGGAVAPTGDLGMIDLWDLPPTVLCLLSVSPPAWMTGQAIDRICEPDADWTDEEQEILTRYLKGLGYLG